MLLGNFIHDNREKILTPLIILVKDNAIGFPCVLYGLRTEIQFLTSFEIKDK